MAKVRFTNADVKYQLSKKKSIGIFIEDIFKSEQSKLKVLNYILCSDEYLLDINKRFLNHDYYTDIITFNLTENIADGILGEIYVSMDRVRENAIIEIVSMEKELLRVLIHGALHLCGYKDKKKSEITIMRGKEDCYLLLFDVNK